jgi:hypothetical protein
VQDIAGSSVEIGDVADRARVSLRDEVETLQGQIEQLAAEVCLGPRLIASFR